MYTTEEVNRGVAHGDFKAHSKLTEALEAIMKDSRNWKTLTAPQRQALKMIMHKIARILVGNPNHPDHWRDIAGYSECAILFLEEDEKC